MGKRNNKNGSQKMAGNATNNDTELACTQKTPVKETTSGSTTANETPVMDNPMELIQKLQTCFQSQETDSNALRSKIQRLEDNLKDTQGTLINTREQSQADVSGLNLIIKNLESTSESLREELQNKTQAYAELEEEYGDDVLNYEGGIKASKIEKEKLQATVKELKSVIQAGCITTEVLKRDFDKERLTHRSEVDSLKATILELQQNNMSKDIEAKPEPSNVDKCISSAPTDKVDTDCENCVLQSAQIKDMNVDLAVQSRSPTRSDIGILQGLRVNKVSDIRVFVTVLTPMQLKRKQDWENSLLEMAEGRLSCQNNGLLDYGALVKKWQASYSYLENLEISQVLYCESQFRIEFIREKDEDIISLRNQLSMQRIETMNCQEKLIASHGKVINGMKEAANIKGTEENIKQNKLKEAHQKAIDSLNVSHKAQITKLEADLQALNTSCETRIMELEKEHLPYRDLAERILAREFEWCKHPRARNEEIIDQGNLAAHGGNCRAVLRRTELNPNDGDNEWFRLWYGISIEAFAENKDSPRIKKLLDMRYEMKKFKAVQLSDTAFERNFQEIMRAVEGMEECQLPTSSKSHGDGDENVDSTSDPIFLSMCSEYDEAAEYEKRRRKSDWKLGHNGQVVGHSIVDRTKKVLGTPKPPAIQYDRLRRHLPWFISINSVGFAKQCGNIRREA
ncbi:uncharacterized protein Bfra_005226 [Botrytis fragariae]|uniref:Uncharacterized protein n=1 Tax=Botrytis fragariae TaxID=1964551 RepID=A0A8H6AUD7_9HELO|nr:uncharacterized protein Bfra_005226 [Botrytis fragariae]KAF5873762.1 hypothetical protein Bfra_005226 [Botrytis fragariae]